MIAANFLARSWANSVFPTMGTIILLEMTVILILRFVQLHGAAPIFNIHRYAVKHQN
jgi:hypothetical protein